jgi:uncharacterized membrane protein
VVNGEEEVPSERARDLPDATAAIDEVIAAQIVLASQGYSGPLPPSSEFAAYGAVLPDAPERILSMAERSLDHNIATERRDSRVDAALGLLGLVFAFLLAVVVLAGAIWLIANDKEVAGTLLATFDLVALVTVFIVGRRSNSEPR